MERSRFNSQQAPASQIADGHSAPRRGRHSRRGRTGPLPSESLLPRSTSHDACAANMAPDPVRRRPYFLHGCARFLSFRLHSRGIFAPASSLVTACTMRPRWQAPGILKRLVARGVFSLQKPNAHLEKWQGEAQAPPMQARDHVRSCFLLPSLCSLVPGLFPWSVRSFRQDRPVAWFQWLNWEQ